MKKIISTSLALILLFNFTLQNSTNAETLKYNHIQVTEVATPLNDIKSTINEVLENENLTMNNTQKEELALEIHKEIQDIELESAISTRAVTSSNVVKIFQTNLKKANSIKTTYNKHKKNKGLAYANTYRLSIFYLLVKSNGPWDLKRTLGTKTKYYFKGTKKTGEYIGNYHYGYMGKAIGFSNTVLKSAAGMYQIKSNTSDWKYISSYFDDPADQVAITNGYKDYNKGYRFSNIIAR